MIIKGQIPMHFHVFFYRFACKLQICFKHNQVTTNNKFFLRHNLKLLRHFQPISSSNIIKNNNLLKIDIKT